MSTQFQVPTSGCFEAEMWQREFAPTAANPIVRINDNEPIVRPWDNAPIVRPN